jgi:hypothetical protein
VDFACEVHLGSSNVYTLTFEAFTRLCYLISDKTIGNAVNKFMVDMVMRTLASTASAPQTIPLQEIPLTRIQTLEFDDQAQSLMERKATFELHMKKEEISCKNEEATFELHMKKEELVFKKEELEFEKTARLMPMEVFNVKQDLDAKIATNFKERIAIYRDLGMDDRDMLRIKDDLSRSLMPIPPYVPKVAEVAIPAPAPAVAIVTPPQQEHPKPHASFDAPPPQQQKARARDVSISSWLHENGKKPLKPNDIKRFGMQLSTMYRNRHGEAPTKHDQFVDGRCTSVNTYTEDDADLIAQVEASFIRQNK